MKFIFSYMKKDAWYITLIMGIKLAAACAELLLPYVLQEIDKKIYFFEKK